MSGQLKSRLYLLVLFLCGITITLVLVPRRGKNATENPGSVDIKEIPGLSVGEIAVMPTMHNLSLEPVRLDADEAAYRFFVVFGSNCDACEKDVEFWRLLAKEAERRKVSFALVAMDSDGDAVRLFLDRLGFHDLPAVFDRQGEANRNFKIRMVPQYLLLTKEGRVVGRWTGLSHLDSNNNKIRNPAEMFNGIVE